MELSDKVFIHTKDSVPKVVKAGEFRQKSLGLDFIKSNLKIDDSYEGDIISVFWRTGWQSAL